MAPNYDFGGAILLMKQGKRVARKGWNGKGMWLLLVRSNEWSTWAGSGSSSDVPNAHQLPWIGMKTADGGFVPWLASQTDILAEDWVVVQEA